GTRSRLARAGDAARSCFDRNRIVTTIIPTTKANLVPMVSTETVADRCREAPDESALEGVLDTAFWARAFETHLLELFKDGLLAGTVHTCIGQELCAAALHPHLIPGVDAFFATHRGHGHYIAHGGPPEALLAELMGREGALCLGRGGTQNLLYKRFFS